MTATPTEIAAVRAFSRFYTRRIGLLHDGILDTEHPLTDARVLHELGRDGGRTATAAEVAETLDLDGGHVSRVVSRLEANGLLLRERSARDRRRWQLALSPAGRAAFARLDARSSEQVAGLLAGLSAGERAELVHALATVRRLLGDPPAGCAPWILRDPEPGDLGWVVARHGAVYAELLGWGRDFEGAAAEIVAGFARRGDARRERCWIAELEGRNVGCVLAMRKHEDVAQLRCLLVEPAARGSGLGRRLVAECVRFARRARYRRIVLWTSAALTAARHVYATEGFVRVRAAREIHFGVEIDSEHWEMEL